MYRVTSATLDSLTLKAPYPVCQAKSALPFALAQREEFVFTNRVRSATDCEGRILTSM